MDHTILILGLAVAGVLLLAFLVVIRIDPSQFQLRFRFPGMRSLIQYTKGATRTPPPDEESDPTPSKSPSPKRPPASVGDDPPVGTVSAGSDSKRNFVVGQPIESDEDFIGRRDERDLVRQAVEMSAPLQILGERRMGKTSLLRWAERHVSDWLHRDVAYVNAGGFVSGSSPEALVLAIAKELGRREDVEKILDRDGRTSAGAGAALESLTPLVLLVDEAANLAREGHLFDQAFLGLLRTLGQENRLTWISASHRDLRSLFSDTKPKLNSAFLNDELPKAWLGQLKDHEVDELVAPLGSPLASKVVELAGGFVFGLQWLAYTVTKSQAKDLNDGIIDTFSIDMEPVFRSWWGSLDKGQRSLLQQCPSGLATAGLARSQRKKMLSLSRLGLVTERNGKYFLPGAAWRDFVKEASPSVAV